MEQYICNKCYCNNVKNDHFRLTQCGHIFCHNCIRKVKENCPECKSTKIVTVPLTKSLTPEISRFFTPLGDILTTLKPIITFQSEQTNIILQCFNQLDNKYEILKNRYVNAVRNEKQISYEYCKLKKTLESLNKQLLYVQMHNNNSKAIAATPSLTNDKYANAQYTTMQMYDTSMSGLGSSIKNKQFKRNVFMLQKSTNNSSISISDKNSL
ncbi:hypothetical protein M0804_002845 [Polistes exclamans]|nr:hypothetical protein M0804_002845 [Polistes exclamans]